MKKPVWVQAASVGVITNSTLTKYLGFEDINKFISIFFVYLGFVKNVKRYSWLPNIQVVLKKFKNENNLLKIYTK